MIRVTVELISAVHPSRNRILGIAEIANDGELSRESEGLFGAYNVQLDDDVAPLMDYEVKLSKREPKTRETWKRGRVEKFNRRVLGAWDLLYLALRSIVGGRNR